MSRRTRSNRNAGASSSGDNAEDGNAGTDRVFLLMQGMLQSQMEQAALVQQQMQQQREEHRQQLEQQNILIRELMDRDVQLGARIATQEQGPRSGTVEHFYKLRPTQFSGDESALDAEDWITSIDEMLQAARIAEEDKIPMVRRLLRGNARAWWLTEQGGPDAEPITWQQFMEKFLQQYFPETEVTVMEEQFMALVQGDKTVDQYAAEFTRLSRFVPELVPTEAKKVKRFRRGLKSEIRKILAAMTFGTFAEILHAARVQEREELQTVTQISPGKRTLDQSSFGTEAPQQGRTVVQETSHPGDVVCRHCGRAGHVRRDCRSRHHSCWTCGAVDHLAPQCPQGRSGAGSSGTTLGPYSFQPSVSGRAASSGAVRQQGSFSQSSGLYCNFCKRPGHIKKHCRLLLGFCFTCGSAEHSMAECPHRQEGV